MGLYRPAADPGIPGSAVSGHDPPNAFRHPEGTAHSCSRHATVMPPPESKSHYYDSPPRSLVTIAWEDAVMRVL